MNYTDLDLAILKAATTNKRCAVDFVNDCDPKYLSIDFWNFGKMLAGYIKLYKDVPTLRILEDQLTKEKKEKQIEDVRATWKIIQDFTYDDKQFKFDIKKLKARYAEKQFELHNETIAKAVAAGEKIDVKKSMQEMQRLMQNIKALEQTKTYERKTLKETIGDFKAEYNAKLKDPNFDRGVLTGYSYLDSVTDGLRDGEMLLIGGESGAGKSMLLMNIALQIWLQQNTVETPTKDFGPGHNVLYFSLEMPIKPCRNRVYSRLSGVPSKLIRNPVTKEGKQRMNAEERNKMKVALDFVQRYPYEFEIIDVPRGCTAENVETLFEEALLKFDVKVVVVDYLGIMDDEDNQEDDWLKLGFIAGKLHELARVHNLILLSAVQLNRAKATKDAEEKIGMHRVGRSALIMHHANIGVQIETRQNEKQYPDMHYHVIKNRDGEQGKGRLIKNLSCGTLLDDEISEEDINKEFTDIDDISDDIEFLDI